MNNQDNSYEDEGDFQHNEPEEINFGDYFKMEKADGDEQIGSEIDADDDENFSIHDASASQEDFTLSKSLNKKP